MTAAYLNARGEAGVYSGSEKYLFSAAQASAEELRMKIKENPAYGNVICRCETVTEGEIVEAIRRKPGRAPLDGVKRRTRAGMGQMPVGILYAEGDGDSLQELGLTPSQVTKAGGTSFC